MCFDVVVEEFFMKFIKNFKSVNMKASLMWLVLAVTGHLGDWR